MRILITGAGGQLGTELQRTLMEHDLVLAAWPEFDLLKPGVEEFIRDSRPDVIIHAAAYTDVDGAEREPEKALTVNGIGTERVARAAAGLNARLIYLSTDYVFDGRKTTPYVETDEPNPLSAYGRSKLEGERRAVKMCPQTLVVRTSWLYGHHGKNFVKTIIRLTHEQSEIKIVGDQRGCPTYAYDLAVGLAKLVHVHAWDHALSMSKGQILHLAGSGNCTWHEFATTIVSYLSAGKPVLPISTSELNRPAKRPGYSVLANRVLTVQGITLPDWQDALSRFMKRVTKPQTSNLELRTGVQ